MSRYVKHSHRSGCCRTGLFSDEAWRGEAGIDHGPIEPLIRTVPTIIAIVSTGTRREQIVPAAFLVDLSSYYYWPDYYC